MTLKLDSDEQTSRKSNEDKTSLTGLSPRRNSTPEDDAENLPYVDESEDTSYNRPTKSDPLDLCSLKETSTTHSGQSSSDVTEGEQLLILPSKCINGDSGIFNTDQEKTSPELQPSNWKEDQNEAEELPERLI